jgi:nicotinamide phosphoribosyltransferase
MKSNDNILLMTDVYKLGHMRMYKPGTTKVYSYLCARSTKKEEKALFFGLQPYIKQLEKGISKENAEEFFSYYTEILGAQPPQDIVQKINNLVKLGYIPLEIKAVPEGTYLDNKNVLVTVTNTHPEFYWVVGFFESLLLKVWNTTSVATLSHKFKRIVTEFTKETSDSDFLLPFLVHDFGYRGVSSEQTAELSGAAHLVNFAGTDTVPAVKFLKQNYNATGLVGASVPASEHSIHCSFGPTEQDELDYVNNMLDLNPTGIVSVVSDAYDYFRMLTVTLPKVKDRILSRQGKYVVRPDSGDPMKILCGDDSAPIGSVENKGTFRILEEIFGATINSKGYKELNPNVGVIYGDGMYFDRYKSILEKMKEMGYANTNLVIGIGGLLLQQHNRDDLGFAFKATYAEINGQATELFKDPATDPGKKSHKGLLQLLKDASGKYITIDQVSWDEEQNYSLLETVFKDGKVVKEYTLQEIRDRASV